MPLICSITIKQYHNIVALSRGDLIMLFEMLEKLRIDSDKTQQEIADMLNCKREVYRRYEKGIYEIPVWAVIKLAQYYHTSTDYLLGLTNNPKPYGYSDE
jgi:transcriptional regulator with XRE-family HTH domain